MLSANHNGLSCAAAARFVAPAALLSAFLFTSGTASAASLQGPVSGWEQGTEPSNMSMHLYVPDNPAPNPPILVVLHYCGGNAGNVFSQSQGGGIVSLADQQGFILLIPQTSRNCWDVGTDAALTNGGGSDTLAIVHQVEYVVSEYSANADRVYVIGTSGGAMGMQGLLAVYPDVFKGGAGFSGVPAGCWAVGNMTDGQWSSACAGGQVTHTPEEWGDIVRNMYPGYTGFRPRVQIWHSQVDSTISPVNQTEAIKQWTNVLGLPEQPTTTSTVQVSGATFDREEWKDECGNTLLDALTEQGGMHNTSANMSGELSMPFLSLDMMGDVDPQAGSDCNPSSNGMGGGGGTDAGGASAMGGAAAGGMPAGGGMAPAAGTANPGMGGTANPGASGGGTTVTGTTATPMAGAGSMQPVAPATGTVTGMMPATTTGMTAVPGGAGAPTAGMPAATGTAPTVGAPQAGASGCAVHGNDTSGRPVKALALVGLFFAMLARRRSSRS